MNALVSDAAVAFWNARATDWDDRIRSDSFYAERERVVADLVSRHVPAGASLLEVGCATGTLTKILLGRGYDAHGCDIAAGMIDVAVARNRAPERFRVAPGGFVPFERTFSAIVAVGVFPYVAQHRCFALHLREHLEPGGVLVASSTNRASIRATHLLGRHVCAFTWTKEWRAVAANLLRTGVWSGGFTDAGAVQCTNGRVFDAMMQSAGLQRIDSADLYSVPMFDREPLARGAISRVLARFLAWTHLGVYRR